MERIVVAAKAGSDQPWLADAAAELAHQTGAAVSVEPDDGDPSHSARSILRGRT